MLWQAAGYRVDAAPQPAYTERVVQHDMQAPWSGGVLRQAQGNNLALTNLRGLGGAARTVTPSTQ